MPKQTIKVKINMPDPEYTSRLLSEAICDIIADRIQDYPAEQQIAIYDELIRELRNANQKTEQRATGTGI